MNTITAAQPFTFHIIYTAGTLGYLTRFLPSLLRWSTSSFRLVANGCREEEIGALERLCRGEPRLDWLILPAAHRVAHGLALNYLQAMCRERYFGFMDSDIFATGSFTPALRAALTHAAAVFACAPVGCTAADQLLHPSDPIIHGTVHQTTAGLCLGGTYLALYDQARLTEQMRTTGIGFETRAWAEIPPTQQAALTAMGMRYDWYDTGKLLNLLLLRQGQVLHWCASTELIHLGGLSLNIHPPQAFPAKLRGMVRQRLQRLLGLRGRDDKYRHHRLAQLRQREVTYSQYFHRLLCALDNDQPLPPLPAVADRSVQECLTQATQALRVLWQEGDV